jgi:hypothetical protein
MRVRQDPCFALICLNRADCQGRSQSCLHGAQAGTSGAIHCATPASRAAPTITFKNVRSRTALCHDVISRKPTDSFEVGTSRVGSALTDAGAVHTASSVYGIFKWGQERTNGYTRRPVAPELNQIIGGEANKTTGCAHR